METISVKLKSGFKCEVNKENLDDMYIPRLFRRVDEDPSVLDELLCRVLGEENSEALYKSLSVPRKGGALPRVPAEALSDALKEIFEQISQDSDVKN